MQKSIRDVITGELSLQYFVERFRDGWKVASIEWVREAEQADAVTPALNLVNVPATVPYGLQVSNDGVLLENPLEATVLMLILDQIVREKRIQEIAVELNAQGYRTREGTPWSATEVFNLLPRLIEAGPTILKSTAWQHLRLRDGPPTGRTN